VHCQCARCNIWLSGNQYIYGEKLGKRKVAKLRKLQTKLVKWTEDDYKEKIEAYKKKLASLEN
jgi:hypothetical protein